MDRFSDQPSGSDAGDSDDEQDLQPFYEEKRCCNHQLDYLRRLYNQMEVIF